MLPVRLVGLQCPIALDDDCRQGQPGLPSPLASCPRPCCLWDLHPRIGSGRRAGAACASAVYRSFVMPVPPVAKGMPMMIDSDTPAQ